MEFVAEDEEWSADTLHCVLSFEWGKSRKLSASAPSLYTDAGKERDDSTDLCICSSNNMNVFSMQLVVLFFAFGCFTP